MAHLTHKSTGIALGAAALGIALLLSGCAGTATPTPSATQTEDRNASWFTDPYRMCIQNFTGRNMPYIMSSGKEGILGSGATECVISKSGGSFENAVALLKDTRTDSKIKINSNNSLARFAWQYAILSFWDILSGPIGSPFISLESGKTVSVVVNDWNVTSYSDYKLRKLNDGQEGYQVDLRFEDK